MEDMDGYLALTVSILKKCPPEVAFQLLESGQSGKWMTDADRKDMIALRKFMSLAEVADAYGENRPRISQLMSKYKRKCTKIGEEIQNANGS